MDLKIIFHPFAEAAVRADSYPICSWVDTTDVITRVKVYVSCLLCYEATGAQNHHRRHSYISVPRYSTVLHRDCSEIVSLEVVWYIEL